MLKNPLQKHELTAEQTAFVGCDAIVLGVTGFYGLSFAPADGHLIVKL